NGDGSFQAAVRAPAGGDSMAVGDFNGDGKPDLAVANTEAGAVSILLGDGDGTFQPGRGFRVWSSPQSVAAGDFNGDGHLDLAVPMDSEGYGYGLVSVFLGNGDGTFQTAHDIGPGAGSSSVAVADFNG